jgi:uncharacterized protein
MNDNRPADESGGSGRCPICGKPRAPEHRPFCSKCCADVDLQRWFSGRYAVPAAEADERGDEDTIRQSAMGSRAD